DAQAVAVGEVGPALAPAVDAQLERAEAAILAEARALAVETRKSLQESLERRTRAAEEKIARSEAQAVTEVRAAAVEQAVAAAEQILKGRLGSKGSDDLITGAINDLPGRLN
ncbi:MAG: F0F1 ATP synthase subunit B, partial [Pseudomonadota bacterium]